MQRQKSKQIKETAQYLKECKGHLKSTTIQILLGNVALIITLAGTIMVYQLGHYIACAILTAVVIGYGLSIRTAYKTKRILKSLITEYTIRLERLNKR